MTVQNKKNIKKVVDLRRKSSESVSVQHKESQRKKNTSKPLVLKLTNPISSILARKSDAQKKNLKPIQPKKKMRLKERRAYKRRAFVYGGFSFAVLGMVGLSLLTWNENLAIRSVVISGNTTISSKLLESATLKSFSTIRGSFISGNTIVTASLGDAEEALLAEFPKLKSAHLRRAGIDAVRLTVVEKKPLFLWCGVTPDESNGCYVADDTGYIFELQQGSGYGALPKIYGGLQGTEPMRQQVLGGTIEPLTQMLQALSENKLTPLTVVIAQDSIDARVHTTAGLDIIFLLREDAKKTIEYLHTLVTAPEFIEQKSNIEYVDMRVGNRLFYKLRVDPEVKLPVEP